MCTRYLSPPANEVSALFEVTVDVDVPAYVEPGRLGLMVRQAPSGVQAVGARWGLIPWFSKVAEPAYIAKEANFESIQTAASFKNPWLRGQRCIVLAAEFEEPNWDGSKNSTWSFVRADGALWALAGIWNCWKDSQGVAFESFALLMLDAGQHPVMSQVNNTRPTRENHWDDKRCVVVLERDDWTCWLTGSVEEAARLVRLPHPEVFMGQPI